MSTAEASFSASSFVLPAEKVKPIDVVRSRVSAISTGPGSARSTLELTSTDMFSRPATLMKVVFMLPLRRSSKLLVALSYVAALTVTVPMAGEMAFALR